MIQRDYIRKGPKMFNSLYKVGIVKTKVLKKYFK